MNFKKHIVSTYPRSFFGKRLKKLSPSDWHLEGMQIAVNHTYKNVKYFGIPSKTYNMDNVKIVE